MSAPRRSRDRTNSFLLASLRTDGSPANLNGYQSPVLVAQAETQTIWSLFSGGRGGSQPAPQAAPEPAEAASPPPAPAPAPEPEPVRMAAVAEAPAAEAATPTPDADPVAIRQPRGDVPLPPPRPFDLGSNRNSFIVAAVAPPSERAVMPPRRPELQASAGKALYFSESARPRRKKPPIGAFDRLKAAKSTLTAD